MRYIILTLFFSFLIFNTSLAQNNSSNQVQEILNLFLEKERSSFEAAKLRGEALNQSRLEWEFSNLLAAREARFNHLQKLDDLQHTIIMEMTNFGYFNPDLNFSPDYRKAFDMPLINGIDYLDREIDKFQNHLTEVESKLNLIILGENAAKSLDPHDFLEYRSIFDNRTNFETSEKYIAARYSFINNLYPLFNNDKELIMLFSIGFDKYADNYVHVMRMKSIISSEEN